MHDEARRGNNLHRSTTKQVKYINMSVQYLKMINANRHLELFTTISRTI